MKTKNEIFTEYFWQNFDRAVYGKNWSKVKRKEKIKRLFK
jgi:hypothetical protein